MKINKFGAIAASAMVLAALAVNASAASLPNLNAASVKAADVDLSDIDWENVQPGVAAAIGEVDPDAVRYTIMETEDGKVIITAAEDVDLSSIDWSVLGEDGENVTVTYSTVAEDGAVSVAAVYPAGDVDFSDLADTAVEGVPMPAGEVNPDSIPGSGTTLAKPVE